MAMTPYNTDLKQCLKWMQNNAPNIQSLINQKANWYAQFQDQFWEDWYNNVFNLRTATPFGLMIWCIILGVPSQLFGLYGTEFLWAYGKFRQNYVWSGVIPPPADANDTGGNFAGGGNTSVLDIQEVRWALQLRYATLVSNGRTAFINYMLNWIFNDGQPWDFPGKRYFYLADCTSVVDQTIPMTMDYHIGSAMDFSAQFITLLNTEKYGIIPQCAGTSYQVILDP